jgi:hypothetical protein
MAPAGNMSRRAAVMAALGVLVVLAANGGESVGAADVQLRVPIIVELFTSEGCSSCPAAERVLDELASNQPVGHAEVVPLAFHVDYWDGLGWEDPFAKPEFTERQYAYARAFGKDQVYTPQMIVAGVSEFGGYLHDKAVAEIAKAAALPQTAIGLHLLPPREGDPDGTRRFRIDAGPPAWSGIKGAADVVLVVTEDGLRSRVLRGENAGRELKHRGVVRTAIRAGIIEDPSEYSTFEAAVSIGSDWDPEQLIVVAFIQGWESRRIGGVARSRIGPS